MPVTSLALAAVAAALGGAINSIAGGGTLLTFPVIVALGVSPLTANVTNTMSLWPGALGSVWGYRSHLAGVRPLVPAMGIASLLGAIVGAWLLLTTGNRRFEQIVPFLVLGATGLFIAQGPIGRWLGARASAGAGGTPMRVSVGFLLGQMLVAVYGGYFGAGIGILMLAALGLIGLTDIHQMNALKIFAALVTNVVAAVIFAASGAIDWPLAGAMAAGSLLGGYGGARLAQRVGRVWVRRAVAAIGIGAFVFLLWNRS